MRIPSRTQGYHEAGSTTVCRTAWDSQSAACFLRNSSKVWASSVDIRVSLFAQSQIFPLERSAVHGWWRRNFTYTALPYLAAVLRSWSSLWDRTARAATALNWGYRPQAVFCRLRMFQVAILRLQHSFWSVGCVLHQNEIQTSGISSWPVLLYSELYEDPIKCIIFCTKCKSLDFKIRLKEKDSPDYS